MASFRTAARTARRLYQRMFQGQVGARVHDVVATLEQVPAFATCSQSTLHDVAESMHRRTYRRDEHIYYEGDPGLGLYIVQQGRVRLLAPTEHDKEDELGQLGPHGMFGTLSLFGDFRRLETAQALTEASVVGFFRPDLKNLMKRNPKSGAEIAVLLARHLAVQHVDLVDTLVEHSGREEALAIVAEVITRTGKPRADAGMTRS